MRKALAVSLLLLAMSAAAYADGNMGDPLVQPPPQSATSTTQTNTELTDGNMGDPLASAAADATTAETALSLLPALLSVL
jgi:hypothetical protein